VLQLVFVLFVCAVIGFLLSMIYRFVLAVERSAGAFERIANRIDWRDDES